MVPDFTAFLGKIFFDGNLPPIRQGQTVYANAPNINPARLAIDQRKGRFYWIDRYTNFTGPHIRRASGENTNDTTSFFGAHHPIDHLIERAIATIGDYQIATRAGRGSRQFHHLTAILFERNLRLPASRRQNSKYIR